MGKLPLAIHGIDFTSAPHAVKPITIASGVVRDERFFLERILEIPTFTAFDRWLGEPGPWIGGFDFPFGLPREAVCALGWPLEWPGLVRHCAALGREAFRRELDRYRSQRPVGDKYPYRRGDRAAGAHSPIKLVNPPVALMFLEGVPRLLAAGVHVPGLSPGDPNRVALEAYPGFAVRRLLASRARPSYKNDARVKQTQAQRELRIGIVCRITATSTPFGLPLVITDPERNALIEDGRGDRLDAVLCALQAAWASRRRRSRFGLPRALDPLEGWIATVPVEKGASAFSLS